MKLSLLWCLLPALLQEGVDSMEAMEAALNFVLKWGGLLAIILIPIWPLLALPAGIFSEGQLLRSFKRPKDCTTIQKFRVSERLHNNSRPGPACAQG